MRETGCTSHSDYGFNLPTQEPHPVNQFMKEWFAVRSNSGIRLCSYLGCGRPKTRKNEFLRCSLIGLMIYCSRAYQAIHWRLGHKVGCVSLARYYHDFDSDDDNNNNDDIDRYNDNNNNNDINSDNDMVVV
ncbi:hypothetical protein Lalb_Chr23g0278051 [Lupinus albus]|uniref:Uncharacterized protein n=1 Tax=Lupinus albus TaxID=3870 RepID=A0A6A4NJW3_LUPAL|nr:hypothetical protein Lalb_Chr23g0278051 [Lupinus albus]